MVVVVTVVEESLLCSFCVVFCRCRYCKSEECLQRLIDKASSALPTKSEETWPAFITFRYIYIYIYIYTHPEVVAFIYDTGSYHCKDVCQTGC